MVVPGYLQKHSLSIASCGQTANTSSRSITPFFLVPIKRGGKRDSAFPHKCTISCAFGLIVFVALVSLSLSRQRQTNTKMSCKTRLPTTTLTAPAECFLHCNVGKNQDRCVWRRNKRVSTPNSMCRIPWSPTNKTTSLHTL
jgi:hypothetical protein